MRQTERHIPAGFVLHSQDERTGVEVWAKFYGEKIHAICYAGKAVKPTWNYLFRSVESLDEYTRQTIAGREDNAKRVAERKAERSAPVDVQVGDVFRATWGYDQTNVDYYEVVRIIGPKTVAIREIACETEATGWAQGRSVPVKGQYVGEEQTKRVQNYSGAPVMVMTSYCNAYRMTPQVVAGVPVYESSAWTAYA